IQPGPGQAHEQAKAAGQAIQEPAGANVGEQADADLRHRQSHVRSHQAVPTGGHQSQATPHDNTAPDTDDRFREAVKAVIQPVLSGKESPGRFFTAEYRLNYSLHRFPKPVIGIGRGIVMGGGLGLMSACRYRLVTPDVTLAMPEISIGLFPDVGASWFLNRLPGRLGLFMGLTGARLN